MLPLQIKAKDTEFHKILISKVNPSCQGTGSEQNSYYQGGTVAKVLNAKVPRFLFPRSLAGSLGSKTGLEAAVVMNFTITLQYFISLFVSHSESI